MPGTTTPDAIGYPTTGDQITPIAPWFALLASTTQTALTAIRALVNTRVHGRASRVTADQSLPAAATVITLNSLSAGAQGVTLAGGGFRVSTAGVYQITATLDVNRSGAEVSTWRDFDVLVNGTSVARVAAIGSTNGIIAHGRIAYQYPLAVNDTVTFSSTGAQSGMLTVNSHAEITRVSA